MKKMELTDENVENQNKNERTSSEAAVSANNNKNNKIFESLGIPQLSPIRRHSSANCSATRQSTKVNPDKLSPPSIPIRRRRPSAEPIRCLPNRSNVGVDTFYLTPPPYQQSASKTTNNEQKQPTYDPYWLSKDVKTTPLPISQQPLAIKTTNYDQGHSSMNVKSLLPASQCQLMSKKVTYEQKQPNYDQKHSSTRVHPIPTSSQQPLPSKTTIYDQIRGTNGKNHPLWSSKEVNHIHAPSPQQQSTSKSTIYDQNCNLGRSSSSKKVDDRYFVFPCIGDRKAREPSVGKTITNDELAMPSPIKTYSNKVLYRNDSKSSDSQNSSPGFLVRNLESPLLPNTRANRRKHFVERDSMDGNVNGQTYVPKHDESCSPTHLISDVVVSYNEESLEIRSNVIPSRIRNCSSSGLSSNMRWHILQIVVNCLMLLFVAIGLAIYFKSNLSNTTNIIIANQTAGGDMYSHTEYSGISEGPTCSTSRPGYCRFRKVPYNYTMVPNYFNQYLFGSEVEMELYRYEVILNVGCYPLAPLYLCSLFQPKCTADGYGLLPCRQLCLDMEKRCGIFMEIFDLSLPSPVNCSLLPEGSSQGDEICVGYNEIIANAAQEKAFPCEDGFKCDGTRCIPADFKCDGHLDCLDETDETECSQCPGDLHCGNGHCVAVSEQICDGVISCPWAQDERNCLRLSDRMGNVGYGQVEVFVPAKKKFEKACFNSWNERYSPQSVCNILGYKFYRNSTDDILSDDDTQNLKDMSVNSSNKLELIRSVRSCDNSSEDVPDYNLTCYSYVCGIRKQYLGAGNTRIVGGVQSMPGDWPFLAAILAGPYEIFYCAGVLISDQWVLSAAHCVGHFNRSGATDNHWTIQLGVTRRHSHAYYGQKIKVKTVIKHPFYNQGVPHNNDIALFQLSERVRFHDNLRPVCIPPKNMVVRPNKKCTVIGWGKREDSEFSNYEQTLYEVQVPILSRALCNLWLKKTEMNVSPTMICAGYEYGGKDACQGDSGGPLLCDFGGKWTVCGIVSWGVKCAHPHLPGIYTYVPKFVSWIKKQMEIYSY